MREPRLRDQFQDLEKQTHAYRLGMWAFLSSETLLFAGLFALYGAYRVMYPREFVEAIAHNDIVLGSTNTVVLLTSSLAVALSVFEVRRDNPRRAGVLLLAAIACGFLFLFLKGTEYAEHIRDGILPGAGYHNAELAMNGHRTFFTLYYLTTGLHALHVVVGIVVLGAVAVQALRGNYTPESHLTLELGGLYWHLVDVVWIFLWPMLYLAR